jgi:hypothetical protein
MEYTVTVNLVFDNEDDLNNMLTDLERLDEEGYFPTGADIKTEARTN